MAKTEKASEILKQAEVDPAELQKKAKLAELEKQAEKERQVRQAAQVEAEQDAPKRVYKNAVELDHDLFKLEPATMLKNISFTNKPHYVPLEHCHIYHTISSDGKKQVASSKTGGHFHLVEVIKEGTEDSPPVLKVGPPLKYAWQRDKMTGRTKRITIPADPEDKHDHPITYLRSEKIRPRKVNSEFVKFQSRQTAAAPKVSPEIKV